MPIRSTYLGKYYLLLYYIFKDIHIKYAFKKPNRFNQAFKSSGSCLKSKFMIGRMPDISLKIFDRSCLGLAKSSSA